MRIEAILFLCLAFFTTGCKSYVVDVGADGSKHISLTNLGFDTKLDRAKYIGKDGTSFELQGYGSDSKALDLLTEVVKRLPVVPVK